WTSNAPPVTCPILPYTTLFRSVMLVVLRVDFDLQAAQGVELVGGNLGRVGHGGAINGGGAGQRADHADLDRVLSHGGQGQAQRQDRKSTRLNSSHVSISYAVFC